MTMTTTPHHPVIPMAALVRGLSPEAQELAVRAITTALNRAHYLDELRDAARNASAAVESLQHDHDPFRGNADPCAKCKAEARENELLSRLDGQVALLKGVRP